jgi:hypothetical protein
MLSYGTLRSHAPDVLRRDGVARDIPSLEVIDYYSRAMPPRESDDDPDAVALPSSSARRRLDAPQSVLDELRSAVFDEGQSLGELRKRFDPVLRPKAANADESDAHKKLKALAERLAEGVQAVDGLTEKRVARVVAMVEALVRDLDELIAEKAPKAKGKGKHAA